MADWEPVDREPCEQDRQTDAPTYRQVHPGSVGADRTIAVTAFTSRGEHKYRLSLACSDAVDSPEHATTLHRGEGLDSVGCVAIHPVDATKAVEVAEAQGWVDSSLPLIDDSACEGVPDHHVYLDYGQNPKKGARKVLWNTIHKLALKRVESEGWAYLDDDPAVNATN